MPHGNHNLSCCQPTNSNRFKLFHVMQESNVLLLTPSGQASIVGKPAHSHEISYIIQPNIKRQTTLTTCPLLYFRNVRKKERKNGSKFRLASFILWNPIPSLSSFPYKLLYFLPLFSWHPQKVLRDRIWLYFIQNMYKSHNKMTKTLCCYWLLLHHQITPLPKAPAFFCFFFGFN